MPRPVQFNVGLISRQSALIACYNAFKSNPLNNNSNYYAEVAPFSYRHFFAAIISGGMHCLDFWAIFLHLILIKTTLVFYIIEQPLVVFFPMLYYINHINLVLGRV